MPDPLPTLLRLLLLEDNAADAELCLRAIDRAGLRVSAQVVETQAEFEGALAAGCDLVIADFHLPCWTGLDALERAHALGFEVPFIMVSGQIGEEAAVECIRRGAADCVLKDRLGRLPLAVRRAMEEQRLRAQQAAAERALRAVEEHCRQLVQRSLAGIVRGRLDGKVLDANPALARMLGYDAPGELLAHRPEEFYWSEQDRARLRAEVEREGSISNREVCLRRRDGSPLWALVNATLIPGEPGQAAEVEATLIDISERKRAEQKILELNRVYSVVSHLDQAIVRIKERGRLLEEVCRIAVEDGGFRLACLGLVNEQTLALEPVARYGAGESSVESAGLDPSASALRERRHFVADRSAAFPIEVAGRAAGVLALYADAPGFFDDRNIELLQQMAADVGFALESMEREEQRKRAEYERTRLFASEQAARAQARAEARFHELMEAAPDAILEVDREGHIVLLNAATEQLFGYRREELLGQPMELLVPERLRQSHAGHRAAFLEEPATRPVQPGHDVWARHKDGAEFPVEVRLSPVTSAAGDLVTCIVRDITHRKRAEDALRESNRQIASILESITDAFFALDCDWRFTYLNSKAEQLTGRRRDDLLGKRIWEQFPELAGSPFEQQYRRAVREQRAAEFTALHPGAQIWTEAHVYPSGSGLSIYLRDITARKQLEEQVQQSRKLEALGRLAGGVAHDFNNLLTIIGGYGQMVLEGLEARNPLRRDLEAIIEAANRASMLTRQLLAFSRRQHIQLRVLELNRLVKRMHRILRRLIGEDLEVKLLLQPDLGRVKADAGQMEQVLMNLAVNARDAMPRGGTLGIQTANVEVGSEPSAAHPELRPGSYVLLAVSDTGTGMDAETLSHIFEPFFTTKPKGKGTGLGLATVYGVVKQSGGEIAVETEAGRGTTFRIYLPRVRKEKETAPRAGGRRARRIGSETILLVEDETEVRRLTSEMLLRQGYRVLEAAGGPEAIRIWEQHREAIDLLVSDVIMPQMSGRELADKLTALQPGLRVLYISGYSDEVLSRHGILDTKTELLAKPFTLEALGARVRRLLDIPKNGGDQPPMNTEGHG